MEEGKENPKDNKDEGRLIRLAYLEMWVISFGFQAPGDKAFYPIHLSITYRVYVHICLHWSNMQYIDS